MTEEIEMMSVAQWIDRYYKRERINSEPGRRERIIADREIDLADRGYAMISGHDCVTGETSTLYNPRWRPEGYIRWSATYADSSNDRSAKHG
jgi:hypothetical protein